MTCIAITFEQLYVSLIIAACVWVVRACAYVYSYTANQYSAQAWRCFHGNSRSWALGPWPGSDISSEPSTLIQKLYTANCTFFTLYFCVYACLYECDFTDQRWGSATPNVVAFMYNWHTSSRPYVRRHQYQIRRFPPARVMMFIREPQAPTKSNIVFTRCIVLLAPTRLQIF